MHLSDLEEHILAHYVVHGAHDLNIVVRAYPHGELLIVIEDKMQLGTRKFGMRGTRAHGNASRFFVDMMIERGAFTTIDNEFGGSSTDWTSTPVTPCWTICAIPTPSSCRRGRRVSISGQTGLRR